MLTERARKKEKRRSRVRKKISGTSERPRLAVFRSAAHIYAQIIDDTTGRTLLAMDDRNDAVGKLVAEDKDRTGKVRKSFATGKALAKLALDAGIQQIAFDRGGYIYHGRIKALADGARDGGLNF